MQFFILYSVISGMNNFVTLCFYLQKRIYIRSKLVLGPVIYEQFYRKTCMMYVLLYPLVINQKARVASVW